MPDSDKLLGFLELLSNLISRILPGSHRWIRLANKLEKIGMDEADVRELKLAAELSHLTKVSISREEAQWLLAQDDVFGLIDLRRRAGGQIRYNKSRYIYAIEMPGWMLFIEKWVTVTIALPFLAVAAIMAGSTILAANDVAAQFVKAANPIAAIVILVLTACTGVVSWLVFIMFVRAIASGRAAETLLTRRNSAGNEAMTSNHDKPTSPDPA